MELIVTAPLAYVLAAVIAHRGQYRPGFNRFNLQPGEALLGDHEAYGMTEQQYRTAKAQLTKWNFATFKSTNKGTVGKLADTRLFSIFRLDDNDQTNGRVTDSQRPKQRTGNDIQDHKIIRSEEPKSTGTPLNGEKKFVKPTLEEVRLYCSKAGISEADADWFFYKCEGNGWTNGGSPIKRWGATLISWKNAGYLPSQKKQKTPAKGDNDSFQIEDLGTYDKPGSYWLKCL